MNDGKKIEVTSKDLHEWQVQLDRARKRLADAEAENAALRQQLAAWESAAKPDAHVDDEHPGALGFFVPFTNTFHAVYAYECRAPNNELVTYPNLDAPLDSIVGVTERVLGFAQETRSGETRIIALVVDEESGELRPCDEKLAFAGVMRTAATMSDHQTRATAIARAWWEEQRRIILAELRAHTETGSP